MSDTNWRCSGSAILESCGWTATVLARAMTRRLSSGERRGRGTWQSCCLFRTGSKVISTLGTASCTSIQSGRHCTSIFIPFTTKQSTQDRGKGCCTALYHVMLRDTMPCQAMLCHAISTQYGHHLYLCFFLLMTQPTAPPPNLFFFRVLVVVPEIRFSSQQHAPLYFRWHLPRTFNCLALTRRYAGLTTHHYESSL